MKKTNKIFNGFSRFFKLIGKFIDKKIILPITRFFVALSEKLKFDNRGFEKALTKKSGLLIMSLVIALGVFIFTDSKATSLIETTAEVLYDQSITATYNEEAYVVEGLPEKVDITLIGRKSDIYLAKQLPTNDITVDLSGLEPGVHKVNLKYKRALSSVEYKLDPSVATIVIYEKVSLEKEINYEVINKDKIDSKLFIENVTLNVTKAFVKGNEAALKNVASIKALIDLQNLVDPKVGDQELKDVKLVAYNSSGEPVKVEVVPAKVTAIVKITSPQKQVPIKVIPKGKVVFGKAISDIKMDINTVTIYGDSKVLDTINSIPVFVDVEGLKDNKKYSITLTKPKGVKSVSQNSLNINISLGEQSSKEIDNIYLEYENLGSGLVVQAIGENNTKVSVSIKGVNEVISALDPTTIKAFVDLKDLGVGEHEIPVKVSGSDVRVNYSSKTTKVTLKITQK
ncbi:MAG: CdaR family protein [Bacilli bacterium]